MKLFSSSSSALDSCCSSGDVTVVVGKVMSSGTEKSRVGDEVGDEVGVETAVEGLVETVVEGGRTEREGLGGRLGRGLE